eukprot:GHVT01063868.1.p1 GENE.GHVT01063868.1~~GHVT01063868.1.p1  ORF type:complete len:331 (+),score=16.41 GHVT01063868.1:179-1171(+)
MGLVCWRDIELVFDNMKGKNCGDFSVGFGEMNRKGSTNSLVSTDYSDSDEMNSKVATNLSTCSPCDTQEEKSLSATESPPLDIDEEWSDELITGRVVRKRSSVVSCGEIVVPAKKPGIPAAPRSSVSGAVSVTACCTNKSICLVARLFFSWCFCNLSVSASLVLALRRIPSLPVSFVIFAYRFLTADLPYRWSTRRSIIIGLSCFFYLAPCIVHWPGEYEGILWLCVTAASFCSDFLCVGRRSPFPLRLVHAIDRILATGMVGFIIYLLVITTMVAPVAAVVGFLIFVAAIFCKIMSSKTNTFRKHIVWHTLWHLVGAGGRLVLYYMSGI